MAWTEEQQDAIFSRKETLLLSAAAGSGKTAVLVERIIQRLLCADDPLDITELLVVTFTKASADEMRERVAAALTAVLSAGPNEQAERQLALLPSAQISTIDSFCRNVLRRYFYLLDLDPQAKVAGEEDLAVLRRNVLEALFLQYYETEDAAKRERFRNVADMFGSDRGDEEFMDLINRLYVFSRSMPWPDYWLDCSCAAYDLPPAIALDAVPWIEPVKKQIHSALQEAVAVYAALLRELSGRAAFAKVSAALTEEQSLFRAADEQVSWAGLQQAFTDMRFVRLQLRGLDEAEKELWEQVKGERSAVKEVLIKDIGNVYFSVDSKQWLDGLRQMAPALRSLITIVKDFAAAYEIRKKEKGWLDFSDLEHFCLRILLDPVSTPLHVVPSLAALELRKLFKEVMIDEYQDTNGVQELITSLVSSGDNRFMVGDIKQSIYRFRLADPTLFLHKYKTFTTDKTADRRERRIDLSKNFRSAAAVIDSVNEVFSYAMTEAAAGMIYSTAERLYCGRNDGEEGRVEVHLFDKGAAGSDDREEKEALSAFEEECGIVARRLRELREEGLTVATKDGGREPLSYRHMVILLRSTADKAESMAEALQREGIPAYTEQKGGYFAAVEVEMMLSLLRCIDNPEQDLPLAAVLRSPLVGLNEESLAELRLVGSGTLWRNLPSYAAALPAGLKRDSVQHFFHLFTCWRTFARRSSVSELLQKIYDDTGYLSYVGAMEGGSLRQGNLKALRERARVYEDNGYRGLYRYLRFIDMLRSNDHDLAPANGLGEGEDVVRIMTIHKSKGLEFPVVVVADMGKSFNRQDFKSPLLFHNELGIGIKVYHEKWRAYTPSLAWNSIKQRRIWEDNAEEERLLYVAMTRAKERLILVGKAADLEKKWRQWQQRPDPLRAKTYLDWICPVFAAAIPYHGEAATRPWIVRRLWHVYFHQQRGGAVPVRPPEPDPRLALVRDGRRTGTEVPSWLEKRLVWQYAYPQAVVTPAKVSVSELKRQSVQTKAAAAVMAEEALSLFPEKGTVSPFREPPAWLAADMRTTKSGTYRGTVFHKVMQYLPLRQLSGKAELEEALAALRNKGILSAEEAGLVDGQAILDFCASPLGRRLAASPQVYREYPFSVLLSAAPYLPALEKGETIMVQGVLDCLFREGNGWVLLDYKTDHLDTAAAFKARYRVQLDLYKRAVEQIRHESVSNVYIYSFYLQQIIPFTV
ncbi:helicase-exonuclease AddAB subunit AddA [Megasphaera vaginalis (ex Bordigoni et al. 2020)]|uniref:helicase-exonuclease AddAB subunit AddA n=1 Tax=Megasphaera vaginalis (ex Bordigoni et al. 2020) TaxID=2045301 RepID=UPI000C7D90E4|nr:helicase-exonuclease AddAB subunit AddA [Megasphaera vaginalis (ex Bordigoni et al. 2020)]